MADEIALDLDRRVVLGKKVKTLRRNGIIPVHVYGANDESESLQCDRATLEKVLAQAGSSTPVFLGIERESPSDSLPWYERCSGSR